MEVLDHIDWMLPSTTLVTGLSNQGKTYFVRNMVDHLIKKKFEIYYVVNSDFKVEKDLGKQVIDYENVYVLIAKDLGASTLNNIKKLIRKNEKPKLLIFDNFTYDLSYPFLNYTTFSRKYNASTVFITHNLFADPNISPKLRTTVNYFIFFYLPISASYKRILNDEMYDIYVNNIKSRSYKFLFLDLKESGYLIDKIPHFKFNFDIIDQEEKGEIAKALKEMMDAEEDKKNDKDILGMELYKHNESVIKNETKLRMSKAKDDTARELLRKKEDKMLFQNKMRYDKLNLLEELKSKDKVSAFMEGMAKSKNAANSKRKR